MQHGADVCAEDKWPSFHVQKTSAKLFYETGQCERAVSIFEAMTLANKEDSETWYLLGLSYVRAGDEWKSDALESFQAAREVRRLAPHLLVKVLTRADPEQSARGRAARGCVGAGERGHCIAWACER